MIKGKLIYSSITVSRLVALVASALNLLTFFFLSIIFSLHLIEKYCFRFSLISNLFSHLAHVKVVILFPLKFCGNHSWSQASVKSSDITGDAGFERFWLGEALRWIKFLKGNGGLPMFTVSGEISPPSAYYMLLLDSIRSLLIYGAPKF